MILLKSLRVLRRELLHDGRGRPTGQRQSMPEMTRLWYLIWISKKYNIETRKFFESFLDAWTHEKSSCRDMVIECRQKTEDDGVFLVTQNQKVVTQLRLTKATLEHMTEIDLEKIPWKESDVVSKINKLKPIDMKIKDVNSEVKWVNLKAKVVKKPIARTVYSRFGNNPLGLSTSTISDDTGSIKMPLWNNQINMVSIGDTIQIENGRIRTFRGELQVSVGKAGKLKVIKAQLK
jgi:replication factor A1